MSEYTAIIKQDADRRIGWSEEGTGRQLPESPSDAPLETLRITPEEAPEANSADARSAASEHFEEVWIDV